MWVPFFGQTVIYAQCIPVLVPCSRLRDWAIRLGPTLTVSSMREEAVCSVFCSGRPFHSPSFDFFSRGLLEAGNGCRSVGHFLPTTWPSHRAFYLTTSGPRQKATGLGLALDSWEASGIFWRQTGLCQQPTAWNRVNRGIWQAVPLSLSPSLRLVVLKP